MKRIFYLLSVLLLSLCLYTNAFAQKKVSILGDSYSTYGGYVSPSVNICWYDAEVGGKNAQNDVRHVEETWWYRLIKENGYQLERNNSFSGATVCCTGYDKNDYSDRAFITRMYNLGRPDVIFIFGGTNDSWAGAPIGEYQYSDWSKEDLYQFRPAFCFLLDSLIKLYPEATIYNITNSELSAEVTSSMAEICRHYNVQNILLHDVEKQSGHPSVAGMKSICEQVASVACK
ncbi:SGNH/GDSL hydrolase family protein [Bacteroides ndongoniae]|uniref:SGNH/GDSL hydrolase family protein n=1 Tax=Bacteroides ndongoniae TaxID=1903262 RepID=UPI0023F73AE6|nr:SGNH/GDSL hydrolase family protein [Bacteroides ndongoniae]